MMLQLKDKTALITGASGGLGAAIARFLHGQGVRVALSGTRLAPLEELSAALPGSVIVPCNLSDIDAARLLIPQTIEMLGGLDILINNAGITRDNLMLRMKDAERDDVLNLNLTIPMLLAQMALRPMMKKRWGRIINICSVVGFTGNPGQSNYCASKAGLVGFSKALAQEVASRGITVNCVAPGFIETDMTNKLSDTQKQQILGKIPAGSMGTGQDVAGACGYLASDLAAYMTGQTLHVNGGMAMY